MARQNSERQWYPLFPGQMPLWVDKQLGRRDTSWNVAVMEISGLLDPERWREACEQTLAGLEALHLEWDLVEPRQKFRELEVSCPWEQWSDRDAWLSWLESWVQTTDRQRDSGWAAAFGFLGQQSTVFVLLVDERLADEHSLGVALRAVTEHYRSPTGRPAAGLVPALKRLSEESSIERFREAQIARRAVLRDPPPLAALAGCPRLPEVAPCSMLPVACDGAGVVPESRLAYAVAAAFAWAYRFSGQRELVVAVPNRALGEEYPDLVGPFEETGYLRLVVEESDTGLSLLVKVKDLLALEASLGPGSLGDQEVCSVYVAPWVDVPSECGGAGVQGWIRPRELRASQWPIGGTLRGALAVRYPQSGDDGWFLSFHEASYPELARNKLAHGFSTVAGLLSTSPGMPIDDWELVSPAESQVLRTLGRGPQPGVAPDVLEAFAREVSRRPDSPAVVFGGVTLSYREFDRMTGRLAARLVAFGVQPGARVAIAEPRGFGEIGTILAILKAGGTYVPVDISHPIERIQAILNDAAPHALVSLSDSPLRDALPEGTLLFPLDDFPKEYQEGEVLKPLSVDPESVAYILFTSGSTGRPKGVEIPRRAISNFLQSFAREPGIGENDRVLAISTTTFDMSELEMLLPLTVGATVVVADRETVNDPERLVAFIESAQISLMQATPATWRMMLDAGWLGSGTMKMLCGGEAISLNLAQTLSAFDGELWNVYGPTETTVYSTVERIFPSPRMVTVGHAIDHTEVTLRDPKGRLVPWGMVGEICIGGRGVALGYWGRPDYTAEKFITDPSDGVRYYRTGDLGRFLFDGHLECLGRIDYQIKVRGFRIEPGDIENHLRAVPGVRDVLVTASKTGDGDSLLVAYWVGEASIDALVQKAQTSLPHYMVPAVYIPVLAFPLNTSGKVDRKKLPPPEHRTVTTSNARPLTVLERQMAQLWEKVLKVSPLPADQDFFTLGGTSLRVVELRSLIRKSFGIEVSLQVLFGNPTIQSLTASLTEHSQPSGPIVQRIKVGKGPHWLGIMGIQLFTDIAERLDVDAAFTAIHVPFRFNPGKDSLPTVQDQAARYLRVLDEIQPHGPYYLIGLCFGGVVAFEMAARLEARGETVASVVLLDAELPSARAINRFRQAFEILLHPSYLIQRLRRRRARVSELYEPGGPIEVEQWLSGPQADVQLRKYEETETRIAARVLNLRATQNGLPVWYRIRPDYGWQSRTSSLESYDIPASHLEIVRNPHAQQVAALLGRATRKKEEH